MQRETKTKAEISALPEGRSEKFLEKIRQFILDLDEREYAEFLYPLDPGFAEDLRSALLKPRRCLKT